MKAQARETMRQVLAEMTAEEKQLESARLCEMLVQLIEEKEREARVGASAVMWPQLKVGTFSALLREPDLRALHDALPDVDWYYPLCRDEDQMSYYLVHDVDELERGSFGIMEPNAERHERVAAGQLDVILCPGFAFGRDGSRLGKGGGYYDRYLMGRAVHCELIGVGFACQVYDTVPVEKHDVRMNRVLEIPSS